MSRARFGTARTVTSILREDGTVYFDVQYAPKPLSEKLCEWTLGLLWFLVVAVLIATLFSM